MRKTYDLAAEDRVDVWLDRWAPGPEDQDRYAVALEALATREGSEVWWPPPSVPGFSRAWLVVARSELPGQLATNGFFTVVAGVDGAAGLALRDSVLGEWGATPVLASAPVLPQVPDPVATRRWLSVFTSAALLLGEVSDPIRPPDSVRAWSAVARSRLAEVTRLERRTPALQLIYAASTPQERARVAAYWPTVNAAEAEARESDHAVAELLAPLTHLSLQRDEGEIRAELAERGRRAATMAGAGMFLAGALIPNLITGNSETALVVITVVVAAWVLLGIALLVRDVSDEIADQRRPPEINAQPAPGPAALGDVVERLGSAPRVLVGPRMGVVDFACAVAVWLDYLACDRAASLACAPAEGGGPLIVVGGPLVRGGPIDAEPVCDIVPGDVVYRGWCYAAGRRTLAVAGIDDALGVLATSDRPDVLFVNGFRDARAATDCLLRGRRSATAPESWERAWIVVRSRGARLRL